MPVLSTILKNGIASDGFVTRPADQLGGMSDGIDSVLPSVLKYSIRLFDNKAACQAERRVLIKMSDKFFEVSRWNGNIRV